MNKEGKQGNTKSDLIHLLLTTPGDRLYLAEFGWFKTVFIWT